MPNDKITAVGANIAEKAAMIWNVADMLRGPFKPHEYGLVILPMTVVKRFHDCLLPTHQAVLDTYEKVKKLQVIDGFLQKASGYQFYNTSRFTFETLLADPDNIESNFRDYLSGFSANAQDVLAKFDFDNIINGKVYGDKNGIYCESKVFESVEFGYNKIVVERPQRDEAGNVILKRGKPVPDTSLRDTENVPLVQDIDAYFAREVLPYAPDAWIDHSKTKVGYEIPMTRYFYEYQAPEAVEDIVARITALEQDISAGLAELFHKEG